MEIIRTEKAPQAIGPYSQAVKAGGFVFCSGQVHLTPDGTILEGDIAEQTRQVMNNLSAVLEAAGTGFAKVVKSTIYLTDMADFAVVNEVYGAYFENENKPARATVGVASLPKGARVEIECIAEV
ncbi:MAG: RidA family protein [Patescibacteria group bacterium]